MPVYGYHGTTKAAATSICQRDFRLSKKDHLWLGKGIYFFQDAPGLAWWWADRKAKKEHASEPAVVKAKIDIIDCMDLWDIESQKKLKKARRYVEAIYKNSGKEPTQDSFEPGEGGGPHRLDYEVINVAVDRFNSLAKLEGKSLVSCVRGIFVEGKEIYETSHIYSHSHIAIAVRNISIITECSLIERHK